ncbi:MAG: hypothetical protein ABI056_01110 [Caulobacteraceae bacterium]
MRETDLAGDDQVDRRFKVLDPAAVPRGPFVFAGGGGENTDMVFALFGL